MMTGDLVGKPSESSAGSWSDDLILEVYLKSFCQQCEAQLEERIRSFVFNSYNVCLRTRASYISGFSILRSRRKLWNVSVIYREWVRWGSLECTYSEPRKWMLGGRVTIQFGCCHNYAVDKNRNPPGIIRDEEVEALPPLFKQMIQEDGEVGCSCLQHAFLTAVDIYNGRRLHPSSH